MVGVGAVVLALIGAGVVLVPRLIGGGDTDIPSASKDLVTDASDQYDYTEPMLDLPRDHIFEFDVDFDLDALSEERGGSYTATDLFQVYADEALSVPVATQTFQALPGRPVELLSGFQSDGALDELSEIPFPEPTEDNPQGSLWLNDEYFLVRRADTQGKALKKPVVTRFTIKGDLETPTPQFTPTGDQGDATLSWQKVEGATEYFIVRTEHQAVRPSKGRGETVAGATERHTIVARTTETTWSSADKNQAATTSDRFETGGVIETTQNKNLRMFVSSADNLQASGDSREARETSYSFAVIASDGKSSSASRYSNALEMIGALPYEPARSKGRTSQPNDILGSDAGRISQLSRRFYYTSLDGNTRAATAQLSAHGVTTETLFSGRDEAHATRSEVLRIPVRGEGIRIGGYVDVPKRGVKNLKQEIAAFNKAARAAAPTTGGRPGGVVVSLAEESKKLEVQRKNPPKTDYPVFGSTPLTTYLARHLIGGTQVIDVSEYADAAGAPDILDALSEAVRQNPYARRTHRVSYHPDDLVLSIVYEQQPEAAEADQQTIAKGVDQAVSEIITEGMSDADRVTAINNWLVANVEYDRPAFEALVASGHKSAAGYEYAFTAAGVFDEGRVVCDGYASAFVAMAAAADLEAVEITGKVLNGGPHSWNKVKVDGVWKAVDVTWNDPGPNRYLMIPDSGFAGPAVRSEGTDWMVDTNLNGYVAK